MKKSRDLFGGALFSAGMLLATGEVCIGSGPNFVFDDTVSQSNRVGASLHVYTGMAYYPTYMYLGGMQQLHGPVGPFNYTFVGTAGDEMTAYANITHKFMRTEVQNHVYALVPYEGGTANLLTGIKAGAIAFVRQPVDRTLHLTWEGDGCWFGINVRDIAPGGQSLIDLWEHSEDGDVLLDLEADVTYRITIGSSTLPFGTGTPWSWVHAELIPAPAALPMLGVFALGLRRRRRT